MCGIAGFVNVRRQPVNSAERTLEVMNDLQRHRGPDGVGAWVHPARHVGLAHRRLSIIDLTDYASQPMTNGRGDWIAFNGEIYNYIELRREIGEDLFRTKSDTEVILRAYEKWGRACVEKLRGMFAFALWDEQKGELFCARDRFGIKPFYYTQIGDVLYFASEAKALMPFLPSIETDPEAFKEYLYFQLCLHGKTLFKGVRELPPAHSMTPTTGTLTPVRYWQVYYDVDFNHTERWFEQELTQRLFDSVDMHTRADVPIGAYISGGLDSSGVACLATRNGGEGFEGFVGKFAIGDKYDESKYARAVAEAQGFPLYEIDIGCDDFIENIRKVAYHMDFPVAGPGSFPQYMVSKLAATRRKVVLGGQGGDEIFGGYARYLIAYFEQCIKAAIDGTMHAGNFIVTYESIIPNLVTLREYKPMLQEFWRDGLFDSVDKRYFRLINRAPSLGDEIRWDVVGGHDVYEAFRSVFVADNVKKESYFDAMTHFDFKTLLPALLHVEDRVSMAHGLESRVPFLDHSIVEFAATMPSNVKFKDGRMKHVLRNAIEPFLPDAVRNRKDKMGFPVPLAEWMRGDAKGFVTDVLSTQKALQRDAIDNRRVCAKLDAEPAFSRKLWGLLSLELWQQEFHDRQAWFHGLMSENAAARAA
jgi:asparagine synthase (glutamine-hydrolysing)